MGHGQTIIHIEWFNDKFDSPLPTKPSNLVYRLVNSFTIFDDTDSWLCFGEYALSVIYGIG